MRTSFARAASMAREGHRADVDARAPIEREAGWASRRPPERAKADDAASCGMTGRWRPTRGPGLASVVIELSGENVTR